MDLFRRLRGGASASPTAMDEDPSAPAPAALAPSAAAAAVAVAAAAGATASDPLARVLSLKAIKIGGGGPDSGGNSPQQQQQQQQQNQQQQQQQPAPWALAAAWGSVTSPPGPDEAAAIAAAAAAATAAASAPQPSSMAPPALPPPPPRPSPHVQVDFLEPQSQHRPSFYVDKNNNNANANAANPAQQQPPASRAPPPPGSTDARARDLVLRGEGLLSVYPLLPHALRRDKWRMRHFELMQTLHKGYASTVYRARCKKTGHLIALKLYFLQGLTPLTVYQTFREVALHSTVVCDGCAALWAAWREEDAVILAQEFVGGGDLAHALRGNWGGRVSERHAVSAVIEPLLTALQYLHARGIAHRDIKPENLLLSEAGVLKIADFGLSIDLGSESAVTRAGTLDYMAPEVLKCPLKRSPSDGKLNAPSIGYGHGVDVWAVGCLAYELCAGVTPFRSPDGSKERTVQAIQRGLFGGGAGGCFVWPVRFSDELRSFVTAALQPDPARRPSALELAQHPWVAQYRRPASQASMAVGGGAGGAASRPPGGGMAAVAAASASASASPRRAPRATVDEVGRGVPHLVVSPAPRRAA